MAGNVRRRGVVPRGLVGPPRLGGVFLRDDAGQRRAHAHREPRGALPERQRSPVAFLDLGPKQVFERRARPGWHGRDRQHRREGRQRDSPCRGGIPSVVSTCHRVRAARPGKRRSPYHTGSAQSLPLGSAPEPPPACPVYGLDGVPRPCYSRPHQQRGTSPDNQGRGR